MFRLLFFVLLIFSAVSAKSCIIQDTKENPDIQVIELDDSSKDSSESEIVALHLPDRRRREIIEVKNEERSNFCKNDDDCGSELSLFSTSDLRKRNAADSRSSENSQLKMDNAIRK